MDQVREILARYAHKAWSGWMLYMFAKSFANPDGSITIPARLVERWSRQANTGYDDLPADEKLSDLKEADEIIALLAQSHTSDK